VPQLVQRIIDTIVANATNQGILSLPANVQTIAAEQLGLDLTAAQAQLDDAPRLLITPLTIVLFAVARGVFAFGQNFMSQALSENIAFDLRNDIFTKIQRLSFSYHDKNRTGQLMIRATDDVERLRVFIGQGLLLALQALILLAGTLIILLLTNARLTLVVLPILPLALLIFMGFGAIAQPLFVEVQKRLGRVNTTLQENLAGLKVVKAFTSEAREEKRFHDSIDHLLEQRVKVSRIFSFLFPFIFLIANLGQAAVLYFGGRQIINGTLTLGEWQKFSLYLIYVFIPMGQLGFIISLMAQAGASAERIFEILDTKNDVENKPGAVDVSTVEGRVEFRDVTFRYFQGSEPVLNDISFSAEPGQTVALLGATGSGKSSIINLIPRFYDVSEGQVLIDGHDVRDLTLESLRQHIGIVLQETVLFSGTIRDNIAFGRPNATDDEIVAAAQAAAAHDFITAFPQGYETPVGERGATLSGGQKQRVAIARALLLDPHILILDDSTSSVDLNTEYEIQKALDTLMKGRTSFVIAQRISTVLNADQILVLDKGSVVARGTHEELMEESPVYADIYHSQLAEDVKA
jgi:ATP-binding cassette subfamily B multidrug efflux pump